MSTATTSHVGDLEEVVFESAPPKSVTVFGAGGNIGSNLVAFLGRLAGLDRATLVDRDLYERKNLRGQMILGGDVGRAKAQVQARRLRRVNPRLRVDALVAPLEDLPLGVLRADLMISCLDSRSARQHVNEIATRLGVPWLDSGVDASGLLARVTAFDPRAEGGCCYECTFSAGDYDSLEQEYPCEGEAGAKPPATNAPAALGGLAASLLGLEVEKWLAGRADRLAPGREILIDAASHTHYRSDLCRSEHCRFDHAVWSIERLSAGPGELTLGAALGLPQRDPSAASPGYELPVASLSVPGQRFVEQLTCVACGLTRAVGRLLVGLRPKDCACPGCGAPCVPTGFDLSDRIDSVGLSAESMARPVRSIGLRAGEVLAVARAGAEAHFELGGPAAHHRPRRSAARSPVQASAAHAAGRE